MQNLNCESKITAPELGELIGSLAIEKGWRVTEICNPGIPGEIMRFQATRADCQEGPDKATLEAFLAVTHESMNDFLSSNQIHLYVDSKFVRDEYGDSSLTNEVWFISVSTW